MNKHASLDKLFRLGWSGVRQAWVAVPENATTYGKRSGSATARAALQAAIAAMGFAFGPSWAAPRPDQLPTNGQVVAGNASIGSAGNIMNINQGSNRAVIDWSTFNVGSAAQVNFNQPSAGSATLNRVQDNNPSQIFGKITAPGQVIISNPNGVFFAPGSSVNVGALTATTHSISSADFMAGLNTYSRNGATGAIVNQGQLQAALGGYIALLAPEVRNEGVIVAQAGTVALAAGEVITLNFDANNTLAGITATPSQIKTLVENKQAIYAPGGLLILSARAMNTLQGGVVRNSGTLSATSLTAKGGRILLDGDDVQLTAGSQTEARGASDGGKITLQASGPVQAEGAHLNVSGDSGAGGEITLSSASRVQLSNTELRADADTEGGVIQLAAPTQPGNDLAVPGLPHDLVLNGSNALSANGRRGRGGNVSLSGNDIALDDSTTITVTGGTGGGTVLVGGDWQGSGDLPQATRVSMSEGVVIDASATDNGDGGKVVLWSREATAFHGDIRAQGGTHGGDGGRIETSSHNLLDATGTVSTFAPHGQAGTWLLDPGSITISTGTDSGSPAYTSTTYNFTAGGSSVINTTTLQTALGSSNVSIATGSGAYDITVSNAISWTSGYSLSLSAGRNITTNAAITNAGSGGVTLLAAQSVSGALTLNSPITTQGGDINLFAGTTAASSTYANAATPTGLVAVGASDYANYVINAALTSNGGNIAIANTPTGNASSGRNQLAANANLQAGGGNIAIAGFATGQHSTNIGVPISPGASIQTTGSGAISLYGKSTSSGSLSNSGIWLGNTVDSNAITISTAGGDIKLIGSATGTGANYNTGISQSNTTQPTLKIYSASGNISLQGDHPNDGVWLPGGTAYIGWDGVGNGTTGNVSITGKGAGAMTLTALQLKSNGGAVTIGDDGATLGSLTLPSGAIVASGNYSGFTIGGVNTTGVTINTALTANGPISITGGDISLNASLSSTASGADILLKASGNITQAASTSVTTAGGKIVYWADSDNSGQGYISLDAGDALSSNGGKIVLAGGLDDGGSNAGLSGLTAGDGIPDGYAKTTAAAPSAGVSIGPGGGAGSSVNIVSGGGDIIVRGSGTASNGLGITSQGAFKIDSGTGTVTALGKSSGGTGIEFGFAATPSWAITSANTSADAIDIEGQTSTNYHGLWLANASSGNILIQATGAGGGVTLKGTGTSGNGLFLTSGAATTQILAQSGAINLTGIAPSSSTDFVSNGALYLGNRKDATAVNGVTPTVSTSSSNITLTSDALTFNGAATVSTTGTLSVLPYGNDFTNALSWPLTNLSLGSSISGLTIGKSATSADGTSDVAVTIGSATSIAGPISIYGGSIDVNANLTSTASGADILLKASGNITQAASTSITTNGGDITLWADSDANGGYIYIKDGVTLDSRTSADRGASRTSTASGGGAITLGGGSASTTLASGTVVPTGYAWNTGTALSAGVTLGTYGGGHNANIHVYSGGGDVSLRGKSTAGHDNVVIGISNYEGLTVDAGTTGNITLQGLATGGVVAAGIDMQSWRTGSAASLLRTADGSITVDGTGSGGSSSNLGFQANAYNSASALTIEATGTGGVSITGSATGTGAVDIGIANTNILAASGAIDIIGTGSGPFTAYTPPSGVSAVNTIGYKAGSDVTASTSNVTFTDDNFSLATGRGLQVNTTGTLTVQPYGTSFSSALNWPMTDFGVYSGITGLTLGKPGNTANITVTAAQSIAGPISIYGGNITLNAGLTATGTNTISLTATGNVTEGASGYVSADKLALLGGNITLTNANNAIGTLAASGVSGLTYIDSDALSIGTVGSTIGVSASGTVSIGTATGDLTLTENVTTTDVTSSALVLNAGINTAAGTASGGNIVVTSGKTVQVGAGGRATLYTGSVAGSTTLAAMSGLGSGSGHFRYNSDESATHFDTTAAPLGAGVYAIYREQPSVAVSVDNQTITYGDSLPTWTYTFNGAVNGDTASWSTAPTVTVGGSQSTSGNYIAGGHTVTASGGAEALGYAISGYTAGTLTVNQKALTYTGTVTARDYDGGVNASVTDAYDATDLITGDRVDIASTGATYDSKDANIGKTVTVTGIALSNTDAGNYSIASTATVTGDINKKTVSLSAEKTYDGLTTLGAGTVTITTGVGSETLSYSGATASNAHVATAGKYIDAITLADATDSSGGLASNYQLPTLDAANAPVTITAKALSATASIGGTLTKPYDGTTAATGANVGGNVTGAVSGDTLTLDTSGVTLAYNSAHVVGASHISASGSAGFTIASSSHDSQTTDYSFSAPSIADATASITPATLTLSLTNSGVTKTYDGTTNAPAGFTPAWSIAGLVTGDTAASVTSTGAAYNSKDVASANKVTVTGASLTGITGSHGSATSDYALAATSVDVGAAITPATVSLSATKTYDGTTDLSGVVSLSTGVGSETLSYSGATASNAHVATAGKYIDAITLADATDSSGGLASNYQLPTLGAANAPVTITAKALSATASIGGTLTKPYDGTTAATGANVGGNVTGAVSGDTLTLDTSGVTLAYNSAHVVGASHISASGSAGFTIASSSHDSQTTDYSFSAPSIADATASITPTTLTLSLTNSGVTKTYDGTTNAPAGFTPAWSIAGLVTGDTAASVTSTGAAYNSKDVASANKVTVTGASLTGITGSHGSATSDYALAATSVDVGAAITPATVSLSATKTYDGTTDLSGVVSLSTGVGSETLSYSGATASNAHVATAGKYIDAITLADATDSSGGLASNYQLPTLGAANAPVTITAKALSATASIGGTLTKPYDGTTAATGANVGGNVTGAVSGDTLTLDTSGVTLAYNSAHVVGASHISASGSAGFTIASSSHDSQTTDYSFSAPSIADATASITPTTLTLSLTNSGVTKTYDGTTNAPAGFTPTYSYVGLVSGDTDAALSNTGAQYDSKNVATASKVTVSGLAITDITGSHQSVASDYVLDATAKDVAASISAKDVTVTGVVAYNKTYDGTDTASLSSLGNAATGVGSETLTLTATNARFADANAANGKTVIVTGYALADGSGLASNYHLTSTSATTTANIAKALLTITANNASKNWDGRPYSGGNGVVYNGFVPNENESVLTGTLAYTGSSQGAVNPGTYLIIPEGLASGNYTIQYLAGQLTIVAAPRAPPLIVLVAPVVPDVIGDGGTGGTRRAHSSNSGGGISSEVTGGTATGDKSSSGITVTVDRPSSDTQNGVISVLVPKEMAATGSSFSFALPAQITKNVSPGSLIVTLADGQPLPAWLHFVAATNNFEATSIPTGALPLKVLVIQGSKQWLIEIRKRSQ